MFGQPKLWHNWLMDKLIISVKHSWNPGLGFLYKEYIMQEIFHCSHARTHAHSALACATVAHPYSKERN